MKTYSIRIFPNKGQIDNLIRLSNLRVEIWNELINIQQKEYNTNKKIFNKFDLINKLPELKNVYPRWKKLNSKAIQSIAASVFSSYRSFFTLIKKDSTVKPPDKILPNNEFRTLTFNQSGWSFKKGMLYINKIPFIYKGQKDYSKENIKEVRVKLIR